MSWCPHVTGFNYEDFKSGSLHENRSSNLEFGNHLRNCLKTEESNHACEKGRQTPTAIYMLISTLNPPLSIQMLSVTCIININKCPSNVLCMLQHTICYLDVLELKNPASDGWFSNEIYLYLVRPQGTEKTCSLRTADVTWLRSPAAVRGYMTRDVPVYVHPHLRHHWLSFIQNVEGFIVYPCVQVTSVSYVYELSLFE